MKFLTNLTLGKKISLLTGLGLSLGVGVFSSLSMQAVNHATETMLQDRMTTAYVVAGFVDETLIRVLLEVENTAVKIEAYQTEDELQRHLEALETACARLSIDTDSIYLVNEAGEVVWSKPVSVAIDIGISAYPSIGQTIRDDRSTISGLVSAPLTKTPVILLASPVSNGEPGSRGALIVAIDLAQSSIAGFVQPIRLGETGYVEIVDQNGVVVARTKPGPEIAPFESSDHSGHFATLIAAGQPTQGVCHTCHEPGQEVKKRDVLAFVPLTQARWGVVIRQSEEEALAPARDLRQNLLFAGLGFVIIALLFVVITTRDVGSRIRMLTNASQRIAGGDLVSPITKMGKDEVGTLSQTLDDMRVKLRASYGELEQKTRELSSLLSVSEILTSAFNLPQLLEAVVSKAVELIHGADGGILLLQDAEPASVRLQCAIGLNSDSLSPFIFTPAAERSPDTVPESANTDSKDIVQEAVAAFLQSDTLRSRVKSSIQAEVFHQNRHTGSLIMMSFRDSSAFSVSDYRLLQAIADYIAIAIERAELAKEAEEVRALQEADRLRSQFISSVTHELRSPLTLIKGYSTSLLRQDVSWEKGARREFLHIIDEKTDELRDLIDKLLQSAKLEAGAIKLEKEPLLIPRLAGRVVEEIAVRAKKSRFTFKFPPSFPVVEADVRYIEQVLRNLVENAVKYSPDGSGIIIAGETKKDKVIVSVSDEGAGIPPEHQQRVFERFYRVDSSTKRGISGSGLGLSIVKGHIEAHGGEVWLESKVGQGSKFSFSLPLDTTATNHNED